MKFSKEPKFLDWTKDDYINANIIAIEPMCAKESLNSDELEKMLISTDYIAEEKLDGTRATLHLLKDGNRVFSRRISKKTDWYAENTDSVPHLRDLEAPTHLYGTILDGEMRIDGRDFKDVSSTLNCLYDEAITRQEKLGFITFHAFDIIYYRGIYIAKMPLEQRKVLLREVVKELNFEFIREEFYTDDNVVIEIDNTMLVMYHRGDLEKYPNLTEAITLNIEEDYEPFSLEVDKRTWYEYILAKGGEGLMLKSKKGTYKHTRGREYTKWKKFETWDVIILDFLQPTIYYDGKESKNPNGKWHYWCDAEDDTSIVHQEMTMIEAESKGLLPVTKHYAMDWIGTVKYGVIINDQELEQWKKKNPKDKAEIKQVMGKDNSLVNCIVVGECSGMDEDTREYMTKHEIELLGTVIEVGANEILKTGKLRHPRYIRRRPDKEMERCIWKDHIRY